MVKAELREKGAHAAASPRRLDFTDSRAEKAAEVTI
jgi:hypothetical protein